MKKIVMILGAVALCCMGLFTSCANDEQDVKIKNWGEMYDDGNYICDVSDIVITGDSVQTGTTFSADYGKISWDGYVSNTNYKDYEIEVEGLKYKVGTAAETPIYGDNGYTIRKIGNAYSVLYDSSAESVTVDPSFESKTFTVKITYKKGRGPMESDSVSMKFTRK